ncbi:MAG TPA: hypothetical protein ENF33_06195 [Nitrososphaeria archaeon]|mgnify:FL=1|nr:MAG: hypothetical protein DRN68_07285 [Nitrososphaerota archaeon]HDJ67282.1 hypothetical protein [Nitrososphaeria archaeon]
MRWKFWKKDEVKVVKPLSRRIDDLTVRLENIRTRLKRRIDELKLRDRELFELTVKAKMEGDLEKAKIYANELSELRNMLKRTIYSDLLLEGVINRIQIIRELDEIGDVIAPVREVLMSIRGNLRGIAPTISQSISNIIDSVESLSCELGTISDVYIPERTLSGDAEKILAEASAIASQRGKREDELRTI